jgi:uncharacterized protein involved in exopolysaccharide biosynthesis
MQPSLVPTSSTPPVQFISSEGLGESPTRQFLFVIFKWRWLILGLGLAFTLAAIVAAVMKPPVQSATAKILLKADRGTQFSGLSAPSTRVVHSPQVLQSEVELFRSRAVLLPVAETMLGQRAQRSGTAPAPPSPEDVGGTIAALRRNLLPTAIPDTNVIQVTYYAPTAEEAERTLKLIVDTYREQHGLISSGSAELLTFYEREAKRSAAELQQAEDALKGWQGANNIVVVESQIQSQIETLGNLANKLHQTEAELEATKGRVTNIEAQAKALPSRMVLGRELVPNPLITKLKGDLAAAEVALTEISRHPVIEKLKTDVAAAGVWSKDTDTTPLISKLKTDLVSAEVGLQDLLQRYTDKDRRVEEKKEQIATIRRELEAAYRAAEAAASQRLAGLRRELEAAERAAQKDAHERIARLKRELAAAQAEPEIPGRESSGPNPLRENLERELATNRSQLSALAVQGDTLRKQVRDVSLSLAALREKKPEADRLSRAVTVTRDAYLAHAKRLEETRLAAGLDMAQLTDVAVIERPYATDESDLLRRITLVGLAAFVGLGLGLATAFGLEFLNHSLRTPEDVEFHLGLPVLAVMPALPAVRAPAAVPAQSAAPTVSSEPEQT